MRPGLAFQRQQYPNALHMAVTRPRTQPGLGRVVRRDLAQRSTTHAAQERDAGVGRHLRRRRPGDDGRGRLVHQDGHDRNCSTRRARCRGADATGVASVTRRRRRRSACAPGGHDAAAGARDMIERWPRAERIDPAERAEPIESTEPKTRSSPDRRADPTEPIDSTEFLEAIESTEPLTARRA